MWRWTAGMIGLLMSGLAAASPTVETVPEDVRRVQFTATEGTWMNLDVHPSGDEVVFDLLGHIYTVPMAGGAATRLTDGHSWNMHPRYSPDGSQIAFTSDRAGGDNLWLMQRDGSEPSGLSDESFRLLSQPDWTPDGRFVFGRKHFTGTRSLGTGEIWAFDAIDGGKGLAWTEKGHLEADINEPHVDPQGTWLYTTEAGAFEYSRNVYGGIYALYRTHLLTGERQRIVSGPGGAIRAQVSPDGRYVGFLRRHLDGQRTTWVLRDLEVGSERVVYEDLDRDQQETWAIHGTYPTWSWLPDGTGAVFYRDGGLVRVTLDGQAVPIPFEAPVDRPVIEPVRQEHPLAPTSFEAKAVRWPKVSPDGSSLLFQAVGQIWIRIGESAPTALTPPEVLAYAPAWHPQGKAMVYTTWSDATGGMVWYQKLNRGRAVGRPIALGDGPDLYTNPAFSADGERIIWARGSGLTNRGVTGAAEPQFYIQWRTLKGETIDAGTVANRGSGVRPPRPMFSSDGDRIWVQDREQGQTALVSTNLEGHDRRVLATSEFAAQIVPSPDGRYLAWKAKHQAYVAHWPPTAGKPLSLGKGVSSVGSVRVSAELGEWISWRDANTLTYAAGPEVWEIDLSEGLPSRPKPEAVETDEDAEPNPLEDNTLTALGTSRMAGLTIQRPVHDKVLAIVGARVIPVVGDTVWEQGVVIIQGDRILSAGPADQVTIPDGADVIDAAGKTVMPGLVDVHAHMGYGWADVSPEVIPAYAANLAYGVTTTHDPSADSHFVFSQRELMESGRIIGPRILSTGYILYGAKGDDNAEVESLDDAREHLRRIKRYGGISVKSYNQPRRDQRQWILQAAREESMLVVPEGGSTLAHNLTMIMDGHTGIEHALPVEQLREDVRTLWSQTPGVHYTPTLLVGYGGVWGEHSFYQRQDVWTLDRLQRYTPPGRLEARGKRRPLMAAEDDWHHVRLAATAWELAQRGVKVNLGAHGQLQGLGVHWELWALGEGGFPPLDAIQAGTLNGAEYLGIDQDVGSIEAGKLADLMILDANPLEDLHNTTSVWRVLKGGSVYDPTDLSQTWPSTSEPVALPWHETTNGGPGLPWAGDDGSGCAHSHN